MSEASLPASTIADVPSFAREVTGRVLRRWGTRIGLTWIGLLVFLAVFSPFLATSFPLLMKQDGHWSSPALGSLSAADVILQTGFWFALILWPIRRSVAWKTVVWCGFLIVVAIPSLIWVNPDTLVTYQRSHQGLRDGFIENVYFAP